MPSIGHQQYYRPTSHELGTKSIAVKINLVILTREFFQKFSIAKILIIAQTHLSFNPFLNFR